MKSKNSCFERKISLKNIKVFKFKQLRGNEQEKDKVNERIKEMRTKLVSIEKTVSNIKNNIKKSNVERLYEIIQEMSKEREEMQNVILSNQEIIEKTKNLMQHIYQKLENNIE